MPHHFFYFFAASLKSYYTLPISCFLRFVSGIIRTTKALLVFGSTSFPCPWMINWHWNSVAKNCRLARGFSVAYCILALISEAVWRRHCSNASCTLCYALQVSRYRISFLTNHAVGDLLLWTPLAGLRKVSMDSVKCTMHRNIVMAKASQTGSTLPWGTKILVTRWQFWNPPPLSIESPRPRIC